MKGVTNRWGTGTGGQPSEARLRRQPVSDRLARAAGCNDRTSGKITRRIKGNLGYPPFSLSLSLSLRLGLRFGGLRVGKCHVRSVNRLEEVEAAKQGSHGSDIKSLTPAPVYPPLRPFSPTSILGVHDRLLQFPRFICHQSSTR